MSQAARARVPAGVLAMGACLLAIACMAALAHEPAAPDDAAWQHGLAWRGQTVTMSQQDSTYVLAGAASPRTVPAQPLRSQTASPLFDGLFALAQAELEQAQVESITDSAFDNGKPIACPCFETGEKWRYVWTRDVSYAADLALARVSPERTRASLRFKLSGVRPPAAAGGFFVAQDTGSGGSWPISSDRVVWFLAARHLVDASSADSNRFADETWRALTDTLAQDRAFVFDDNVGLYRGETSYLDWREQSYPRWTANDVGFIAQSFALSTNVLQYQALRLGEKMAGRRGDPRAATYSRQADALGKAIDRAFWREDRGLYMSYIGTAEHRVPFEAYDLLGLALVIESGIAPADRARRALSRYPALDSGSPVIWPQQPDTAIYHNRAIWPFVSAYSLRAARTVGHAPRIAHEIRSMMRGAALAGSNMENFELVTQAVHVEDGAHSGPVVNSPRQLWSVAAYLDMVIQGVFGVGEDGSVKPMLPAELVPTLFGDQDAISLQLRDRKVTLRRPRVIDGDLLVAGSTRVEGSDTLVDLTATRSAPATLATDAATFAPPSPEAPQPHRIAGQWQIVLAPGTRLYVDGKRSADSGTASAPVTLANRPYQQCLSLTRVGSDGLESLHSPTRCIGEEGQVAGEWPRQWTAPAGGTFSVRLDFLNAHGPINTGITAAVKVLVVDCAGQPQQTGTLVMPHGQARQLSSAVVFDAKAGAQCRFDLRDGFNMSYLSHFAHYTGGTGGATGALNSAQLGELHVVPVAPAKAATQ
ncbi:Six-hairpin glycosidase-like protein [Lysobacter sp. S4-A87]|uniref:Six-hairpin glycosidase-like protein n=1 Tax=Lysobacter sp. S4-A87 TaxID=2925843 RepID=UPI001F52FD94|nr:Six-hairpin glycosidase-like protein [Lysobacter sp. S4-A87]UNK48053.1 Six-hairpin glycosidase-like protein [Lysobacter sp. S4-A87]